MTEYEIDAEILLITFLVKHSERNNRSLLMLHNDTNQQFDQISTERIKEFQKMQMLFVEN